MSEWRMPTPWKKRRSWRVTAGEWFVFASLFVSVSVILAVMYVAFH